MQCFRHHNLFPFFWISILKNWFIFGEQNHFCFRIWQNIASRLNITYWKWVKKIVLFLGLCKLFFLYSFFLIYSNYHPYSGGLLCLLFNVFLCFIVWTGSNFNGNYEHLLFKGKRKLKLWVIQFWKQYQVRNIGGYFTLLNSTFSKRKNKSKLHQMWLFKNPNIIKYSIS